MHTARSLTICVCVCVCGEKCKKKCKNKFPKKCKKMQKKIWGVSPPGPLEQTPLPQIRHSPWEQTPPLWIEFLTHGYENITLPQTSFEGGN